MLKKIKIIFLTMAILSLSGCFKNEGDQTQPIQENNNQENIISCEVLNCHIDDENPVVKCGPTETNRACTMEFKKFDYCLPFAVCEQTDGQCKPSNQDKFNRCLNCVKNNQTDEQAIIQCLENIK